MGDLIVHNGLIRKLSEDYPDYQIYVPSVNQNFNNVEYMFRDDEKITVVNVIDEDNMNRMRYNGDFDKIISTHHGEGVSYSYDKYFDDSFYLKIQMDPKVKQDYFYLKRDYELENNTFDEMISSKNITDYIFIHEKRDQRVLINRDFLDPNLPIITADNKYSFFSLLKVIENAKSVHLISSSFLSLMLCKKYNQNVFAHMYADRMALSPYIRGHNIEVIV
jgi:hypothetical protein